MARRVAWSLKDTYPTVVARGVNDDAVLMEAIADLAQLTGRPVLFVLELVPESTLDRLFSILRARTSPRSSLSRRAAPCRPARAAPATVR